MMQGDSLKYLRLYGRILKSLHLLQEAKRECEQLLEAEENRAVEISCVLQENDQDAERFFSESIANWASEK